MSEAVIPQRPYLLRAMHQWITDNGQTAHIVVDAEAEGVEVPERFVRDGKIILNISAAATTALDIGNEFVTFEARFSGVSRGVCVPVPAVLGIYARESGRGMIFSEKEFESPGDGSATGDGDKGGAEPPRPTLRVVK